MLIENKYGDNMIHGQIMEASAKGNQVVCDVLTHARSTTYTLSLDLDDIAEISKALGYDLVREAACGT